MSTESQYYKYNPEKRNIFIEIHHGRTNYVSEFILGFFLMFASQASAIVEVFIRRRFGERYITLAQSIALFILMIIMYFLMGDFLGGFYDSPFTVIFALTFLGMSIYHRLEIKRYGTTYDFKRFSLSDGEVFPFLSKMVGKEILGIRISSYHIRVLIEPAIPILMGILIMGIPFTGLVGILLFLCGILFGIRNFHKAQQGRNWVLDNIDKKIANEMKYDVFIGQKPSNETKGVYLPIELPKDEDTRESLYNMIEDSFERSNDIWESDFSDGIKKEEIR